MSSTASWREAVMMLEAWARGLAELERKGLGDTPLGPDDLVADPPKAGGADSDETPEPRVVPSGKKPSARFTPPEQIDGAPWDAAARRYVLGLVTYRMLAGALPFAGEGLRRDVEERATRGVPPFPDEIAATLKPGVQSLVLRILSPKASERPRSADEIARECRTLLSETSPGKRRQKAQPPIVHAPVKPRIAPATGKRKDRIIAAAIVFAGILVATLAAFARPSAEADEKLVRIAPVTLRGTLAQDCAGCHPREVSEWKRSVMAHASKSPLFGALESAVEEQIGNNVRCPSGAGVLRSPGADACFDDRSGNRVTGSGGEGWCINCHAPGENLAKTAPAWSTLGSSQTRAPLRDVLSQASLEGISCAVCHQTIGPVGPHRGSTYEGNASWTSFVTGAEFLSRPEDRAGTFGVANSGYALDTRFFRNTSRDASAIVHGSPSRETDTYLRSSEFCGACHDVRLFGTDVLGVERGEHFKRLRNAYSEWRAWSDTERSAGREPATCQGCHMSQYPGVCVPAKGASGDADCPAGTRFSARAPVVDPRAVSHYFTSVEVPMTPGFPEAFASDATLDAFGVPVGLRQRRDAMLRHTFALSVGTATRTTSEVRIPIHIENVGAGHRVPAGFSQEREIWIELEVRDARGDVVYRVGHVDKPDEDLADKRFLRVSTSDDVRDGQGRPLGVFGADVVDGPDVGQWNPPPSLGGTTFEGKGLINFQNGFLRCVRCIGTIDDRGRCLAGEGQGKTRADRFTDGAYDLDTGECRSNLSGQNALFETYFPIGSLDADRGVLRAPDAIIDTRSAAPGVPVSYTYVIDPGAHPAPYRARATLHFRAFPPFLLRAFADYEARMALRGLRPSGAQVTADMISRLEVIDLATTSVELP